MRGTNTPEDKYVANDAIPAATTADESAPLGASGSTSLVLQGTGAADVLVVADEVHGNIATTTNAFRATMPS